MRIGCAGMHVCMLAYEGVCVVVPSLEMVPKYDSRNSGLMAAPGRKEGEGGLSV